MKFKSKKKLSVLLAGMLLSLMMISNFTVFAEEVDTQNEDTTEETQIVEDTALPEKPEEVFQPTIEVQTLIAPAYMAPVTLPAPINQAFPTPAIASAIASAVYSNSGAVGNTVNQAQLDAILQLDIGTFSGTLDLAELTAYGGFPFLQTFNMTSYGTASFPRNFDTTNILGFAVLLLGAATGLILMRRKFTKN